MVQPDTNGRGGWLEGKAGRGEFPEMKGYADTPDRHRHARECAPADAMTRTHAHALKHRSFPRALQLPSAQMKQSDHSCGRSFRLNLFY